MVATISFGAWSLFYAIVGRRYPGRISFIQEGCIGLFDSIVRNFPELVISYENNPVGKNLVLLKGAFLNTGTKDITKEMVSGQLTIALPAAHHWLSARVVAASPDVVSSIMHSREESRLAFDLGLFRSGEYVRFEALAVIPASEQSSREDAAQRLKEVLTFEHRIADTRKVEYKEIPPDRRRKRLSLITMLAGNVIIAGIGLVLGFWWGSPTQEGKLRFWLMANDSKSILVTIRPLADGNLRVNGVNEKFEATMPAETFFYKQKWKPVIARDYFAVVSFVMMAIIFVSSASMATYLGVTIRREARLKDLLSPPRQKKEKEATR